MKGNLDVLLIKIAYKYIFAFEIFNKNLFFFDFWFAYF